MSNSEGLSHDMRKRAPARFSPLSCFSRHREDYIASVDPTVLCRRHGKASEDGLSTPEIVSEEILREVLEDDTRACIISSVDKSLTALDDIVILHHDTDSWAKAFVQPFHAFEHATVGGVHLCFQTSSQAHAFTICRFMTRLRHPSPIFCVYVESFYNGPFGASLP